MQTKERQREEIMAACESLFARGQVAELRILSLFGRTGLNAAGWFNDWERLAESAIAYDAKKPEGIYVTLNALHPGCLARCPNAVMERPSHTSVDSDIVRRHWLPVDVDPVRPSGISSSEDELLAAIDTARNIAGWLESDMGFPPGLRAVSGNGAHLLYRVDMEVNRELTAEIKDALTAIVRKFSGDGVKVDCLYNPARIWKLYGTRARKGQETENRRHRLAELEPPKPSFGDIGIVGLDACKQLAAIGRSPPPPPRSRKSRKRSETQLQGKAEAGPQSLEEWLAAHHVAVKRTEAFDGAGTRFILDACVFDPGHSGTSAAFGQSAAGARFYKCWHDSCVNRGWRDAKAVVEAASGNVAGEAVSQTAPAAAPAEAEAGAGGGGASTTAEDANPWSLAGRFIEEHYLCPDTGLVAARRYREQMYVYVRARKRYEPMSLDCLTMAITRWLGSTVEKVTQAAVRNVLLCVQAMLTVPGDKEMPFLCRIHFDPDEAAGGTAATAEPAVRNWVSMQNGILDIDALVAGGSLSDCFHPHTVDWFSVISLPFCMPQRAEDAECPQWLDFLSEIFEGDVDTIAVLQEAFGYCFFQDVRFEKFFTFFGIGANGKSTVLKVLIAVLGEDNTESLSPDQVADKYLLQRLHGKLANICADMSEVTRVEEGLIKAMTSGDTVTADRKYMTAMKFVPRAKLFFATNVLPRITDTSLGTWRRMVLIPFNLVVTPDRIDTGLLTKLRAELPGIFVWALRGTRRLVQNSRFTLSTRCAMAQGDYKAQCFPVLSFLEECVQRDPVGVVTAHLLWKTYRRWCLASGLHKLKPIHTFTQDVLRLVPNLQFKRTKGRMERETVIYGLAIRPGIDDLLDQPLDERWCKPYMGQDPAAERDPLFLGEGPIDYGRGSEAE